MLTSSYYNSFCISMFMNFSGNYFSVPLSEPSLNGLVDDPSLNNFLDSGSCQLLGAQLMPDEGRIIFNTKASSVLDNVI